MSSHIVLEPCRSEKSNFQYLPFLARVLDPAATIRIATSSGIRSGVGRLGPLGRFQPSTSFDPRLRLVLRPVLGRKMRQGAELGRPARETFSCQSVATNMTSPSCLFPARRHVSQLSVRGPIESRRQARGNCGSPLPPYLKLEVLRWAAWSPKESYGKDGLRQLRGQVRSSTRKPRNSKRHPKRLSASLIDLPPLNL